MEANDTISNLSASDNEVMSYLKEIASTDIQTLDLEFYLKKLTHINEVCFSLI